MRNTKTNCWKHVWQKLSESQKTSLESGWKLAFADLIQPIETLHSQRQQQLNLSSISHSISTGVPKTLLLATPTASLTNLEHWAQPQYQRASSHACRPLLIEVKTPPSLGYAHLIQTMGWSPIGSPLTNTRFFCIILVSQIQINYL